MRINARVILATMLAALIFAALPSMSPGQSGDYAAQCLFRASFNKSLDADLSNGQGKPVISGNVTFADGVSGRAAVVGPNAAVVYPLKGNLSAQSGTIAFWAKPIGWSGADGQARYFVILTGNEDWMILQTSEKLLAFLGGNRKSYNVPAAPIATWRDGQWRFVTVTWDQGKNRIYLDGELAATPGRWPVKPQEIGDSIRLGSQLFGSSTGNTAIDEFSIYKVALSDNQIRSLYRDSMKASPQMAKEYAFLRQQRKSETDNIAKANCGAILLPSSQVRMVDAQVERIMDGDFDTRYTSGPGTYPNWIEIRWPQPVSVYKLVVNEDPGSKTAKYRVDAMLNGKWVAVVKPTENTRQSGERIVEEFPAVETTRIRYYMLAPESPDSQAQASISELQICGSADWIEAEQKMSKPNWRSQWIWYPEGAVSDVTRYMRKHFMLVDPSVALTTRSWPTREGEIG